jgi:hypothetical protein
MIQLLTEHPAIKSLAAKYSRKRKGSKEGFRIIKAVDADIRVRTPIPFKSMKKALVRA